LTNNLQNTVKNYTGLKKVYMYKKVALHGHVTLLWFCLLTRCNSNADRM